MSASVQERGQLIGGLVELLTRRTAAVVAEGFRRTDPVAIAVVLGDQPAVPGARDDTVAVLDLDGQQAGWAQQEVIDLAATVAVAPQQHPFIPESSGQGSLSGLFALHAGRHSP